MMNEPRPGEGWSWTPRNLSAIALLTLLLGGLVAWRAGCNRARLTEELTVQPGQLVPAAEKIDPNTASWASLARLPGIGPGRAKGICAWRDRFTAEHPGQQPFARPADLQQVPDIGPATVTAIAPYLTFPAPATTMPDRP